MYVSTLVWKIRYKKGKKESSGKEERRGRRVYSARGFLWYNKCTDKEGIKMVTSRLR